MEPIIDFKSYTFYFPHRFAEDGSDLMTRKWTRDISINDTIEELVRKEFTYYDGFYCDLYVRHHFYCAGTAPFSQEVCNLEELKNFLELAKAGDYLEVWSLTDTPKYYVLRCPNKDGLFPLKGAY